MIVRELVTKLGFQFDRSNLDKFEKSIVGFKTKMSIATAVLSAGFAKTLSFFSNLADSAVATKDLADYAGVAVDEFIALREAANKFSIDPKKFEDAFSRISISIKEASRGVGGFIQDIHRQSRGLVNFKDAQGNLRNTKDVLKDVLNYVNQLTDKSEQLRILGNIFGPDQAGAWLRLIQESRGDLEKLIENERDFAAAYIESLPQMQNLQKDLRELNSEWEQLTTTIASKLVPVVSQTVKGFNEIVKAEKQETGSGILGAAKEFFFSLGEIFLTDKEIEDANLKRLNQLYNSDADDFNRRLSEEYMKRGLASPISINNTNNIDINVPPGTSSQQSDYMAEQMKSVIESTFREQAREIMNNHPQVE